MDPMASPISNDLRRPMYLNILQQMKVSYSLSSCTMEGKISAHISIQGPRMAMPIEVYLKSDVVEYWKVSIFPYHCATAKVDSSFQKLTNAIWNFVESSQQSLCSRERRRIWKTYVRYNLIGLGYLRHWDWSSTRVRVTRRRLCRSWTSSWADHWNDLFIACWNIHNFSHSIIQKECRNCTESHRFFRIIQKLFLTRSSWWTWRREW